MHVCHICGAKNASLTPFAKHLFLHLNRIDYICFPCTEFLTSRFQKSYMTNNVFFVSEKNSFEPAAEESSERITHLCGECHSWFSDYKDFVLHTHVHKQEFHQCPTCILSFPINLEHSHANNKPMFNCVRCKSTFVAASKCNIFEPLIFCNIEKLSSDEPDMTIINQLFKQFKLCFTIQERSRESTIIANSITSTSHTESCSKEKPSHFSSNLITSSSLKVNTKSNKKQVSLKTRNGSHNSKCRSQEKEILNSSNVEGNTLPDSFSVNNSCTSSSCHLPPSCSSPEFHHCVKQYDKNIAIQPLKLNSSEMVKVSSSPNYHVVKSIGNKLILKLQDSNPESKLMNRKQKVSFSHNINQKNLVKPNFFLKKCQSSKHKKFTCSEKCCVRNLNSKKGSNKKDSRDCTANQKKGTTQATPYITNQLNNHLKNASLDISGSLSEETTSVSPSMPISFVPSSVFSSVPLIQSNMPVSNSSHILKNIKDFHHTDGSCNLKSQKVNNSKIVNRDKTALLKPKAILEGLSRSALNSLNNYPRTKNVESTLKSKACAQNNHSYAQNCSTGVHKNCLDNNYSVGHLRSSGNLYKSSELELSNYDRSKKKGQKGEKLISNSDIPNNGVTNPLLGFQTNVDTVCFNLNECSPVDFERNLQKTNEEKVGNLANIINSLYKQRSNKCFKVSQKGQDSRALPKITEDFCVTQDSSKHQIQQTMDYQIVPYKDISSANDTEGNNSLLTIRSSLSSPVNSVKVIPNKGISANSALLKKMCSKNFFSSSVSGNTSSMNSDVLQNNETPSRNIVKSHQIQNLETDIVASKDSFLISNDTERLKNQVLKNSEKNQRALMDLQSVKNFDTGHNNLYVLNNLIPMKDVQAKPVEISGENRDIIYPSDNLILQNSCNSRLYGKGAVFLNGFKVGNKILINYNQNKEVAQNLYPFRKFQNSNTDGWLSIPVEMVTLLGCKQNDTVCSNSVPIQENFDTISDKNKIVDDICVQPISSEELRKRQDVSLNSLQCQNISALDVFQNNQHSVNLETEIISNDDSQPELNNSELLNNENLKSCYSNNNAPKCHDSFQNNTKPISIPLCNNSKNLNCSVSVDEKCMNNGLLNDAQSYECSKVANIDGSVSESSNLKRLANENSQNINYPNLMPPEHKVGRNINPETNSGYQKSVRSPGSKDYDKSELFYYEDALIENSLLNIKDSKVDPVQFSNLRSENNDNTMSMERGSASIPDSTNNFSKSGTEKVNDKLKLMCNLKKLSNQLPRTPSVIYQKPYSTKHENSDQVLNNSKKLSVLLTKLPHYVRTYRTYKIYARSQKRKLALQKKKKLKSANEIIPDQGNDLLCAPIENDSSVIGNCINVDNASTLIDTETVCAESNFQLQSSCDASSTEPITISRPTNLHTMKNYFVSLDYSNKQPLETPGFNSHIKEEFDICNQKFVEQAKTPIVSTSVDMETSYINSGSQLLPLDSVCSTEMTNKYSTDLHTMERDSFVGNYAYLDHMNVQTVETPVSLSNSCVKQLDFYNQQLTEQIENPDNNQAYALSTPNTNELNPCQLSVPLTSTSELNSCHQQLASLTENSNTCDNLFESELLDIEQVPMLSTDVSSPSNNSSCLEMLPSPYQGNSENGCNLVSPHLPSTSDSFYLMSNYQNRFDAECYQKSLENMDTFCLWKTEYQLKYLKDRIEYINETLFEVVERRQKVKILEPRILLHKLPDSVYEKYLKQKPIMLTSILPTITSVHSLSSEKG